MKNIVMTFLDRCMLLNIEKNVARLYSTTKLNLIATQYILINIHTSY